MKKITLLVTVLILCIASKGHEIYLTFDPAENAFALANQNDSLTDGNVWAAYVYSDTTVIMTQINFAIYQIGIDKITDIALYESANANLKKLADGYYLGDGKFSFSFNETIPANKYLKFYLKVKASFPNQPDTAVIEARYLSAQASEEVDCDNRGYIINNRFSKVNIWDSKLLRLFRKNWEKHNFELWTSASDTSYLLPGEYFYCQARIYEAQAQESILALSANLFYDLLPIGDVSTNWQNWYGDTIYGGTINLKQNYAIGMDEYTWMSNSSSNLLNHFWLFSINAKYNLKVGDGGGVTVQVQIVTPGYTGPYYLSKTINITGTDRLRGDITGDGIVDKKDLKYLVEKYDYYTPYKVIGNPQANNVYTKKGNNLGAGAILFDYPELISTTLLNIWINDPNDPLVQGLGIGNPMSSTVNNNKIEKMLANAELIGNTLTINAPGANIVSVRSTLKSGRIETQTLYIENGTTEVTLSDSVIDYKIEAVKLDGLEDRATDVKRLFGKEKNQMGFSVYPNPATDRANIKFADNNQHQIQIFDITGKEIFSLKGAGSLTWNPRQKGLYIVKSENYNTKKIIVK